jgi:hypothetical protein
MKRRLLDRFNDQAFEALSAVRYRPVRRIGFLDAAKSRCWRQLASRGAADRGQRVTDLAGKIKIAWTTPAQKQRSASGLPIRRNNRTNASMKL